MDSNFSGGLYVSTKPSVVSRYHLSRFVKNNDIPNPVPTEEFHCTIQYSKQPPSKTPPESIKGDFYAVSSGFDVWPTQDGRSALVMCLHCPELVDLHKSMKDEYNLSYDYDEYKPHITLSYNVPESFKMNSSSVFALHFNGVTFKPLNEN